jgi:DNA-binding HxlR family transcriptional regulator
MDEINTPVEKKTTIDKSVCPIAFLLEILSCKWSIEILRELSIQPTRTRQFLARVPGLSMKVLQERLHMLEQHHLIDRNVTTSGPKKVEYFLTEKGRQLPQLLAAIKKVAEDWLHTDCICSFDCPGSDEAMNCPARPQDRRP